MFIASFFGKKMFVIDRVDKSENRFFFLQKIIKFTTNAELRQKRVN